MLSTEFPFILQKVVVDFLLMARYNGNENFNKSGYLGRDPSAWRRGSRFVFLCPILAPILSIGN
jgi:hypothetical protein